MGSDGSAPCLNVVFVFDAVSGKKRPWSWDLYLAEEVAIAAPLRLFTEVPSQVPHSSHHTADKQRQKKTR